MCAGMYEELRAFPKPELHHSPFTLIRGTKILPEHVNHESVLYCTTVTCKPALSGEGDTVSRNVSSHVMSGVVSRGGCGVVHCS